MPIVESVKWNGVQDLIKVQDILQISELPEQIISSIITDYIQKYI